MIEKLCSQLKENSNAADHRPLHRFPEARSVYLMDNHKWALYAWFQYSTINNIKPLSLFHADMHWDAADDFSEMGEQALRELMRADFVSLREIIKDDKKIRYDSFIVPAVLLGIVDDIHWFCFDKNDSDEGITENEKCKGLTQKNYRSLSELPIDMLSKKSFIYDLCLDLFNDSEFYYTGEIWEEDRIRELVRVTSPLIQSAKVVTISLSYGYSGSEEDTIRLAKIVVPEILALRPI